MHFHRNISFPNCLSHSFSTVSHLCWLIYIVCVGLLYHCWSALKRWTVYNFGQQGSTKPMQAASGFILAEKTSPLWSVLKAKCRSNSSLHRGKWGLLSAAYSWWNPARRNLNPSTSVRLSPQGCWSDESAHVPCGCFPCWPPFRLILNLLPALPGPQ